MLDAQPNESAEDCKSLKSLMFCLILFSFYNISPHSLPLHRNSITEIQFTLVQRTVPDKSSFCVLVNNQFM